MKKTCAWCEGKGVVGKLVRPSEIEYVMLLGRQLPVVGTIVDQPCKHCGGTGEADATRHSEPPGGIMSDAPNLTVPELEALLARAKEHVNHPRHPALRGNRPSDWTSDLATVCRQALAQAAEIGRLRCEAVQLRSVLKGIQEAAQDELRRPDCPNFLTLSIIDGDARAALATLRNPKPPRLVPCPRCQGKHVCVGCEPGLCEFPCYGCNCTGTVKESSC